MTMHRFAGRRVVFAALLALPFAVSAQNAPTSDQPSPSATPLNASEPGTTQLSTVAVTGTLPGPGLWKVSKGDHVLWILGTLSPLPRDMRWKSNEIEAKIADAQEVLTGAQVEVHADTGFFGKLAMLPSLIGVRDNPDGAELHSVVPPDLYARWETLKRKYMGRGDRVEKWRPLFAAIALYDAALEKNRLTGEDYVLKTVRDIAKRDRVAVVTPTWDVMVEKPREAIRQFKAAAVDDVECFRQTLDRVDMDLPTLTARANAWATGDVAALRELPQSDQMAACVTALSQSSIAREHGMTDLDARTTQVWLDAASAALARNATTVAVIPIRHVLDGGYLTRLQALGYIVEAPDADGDATDPTAGAALAPERRNERGESVESSFRLNDVVSAMRSVQ